MLVDSAPYAESVPAVTGLYKPPAENSARHRSQDQRDRYHRGRGQIRSVERVVVFERQRQAGKPLMASHANICDGLLTLSNEGRERYVLINVRSSTLPSALKFRRRDR
jgi:hypothetical protein